VRALRGVVASAVTVLLAALAHTVAGGDAPAPLLLVAAAILAAPPAVALVGKRPAAARTTAAVLVAQLVFHGVFLLFGSGATTSFTGGDHTHMAGHMVMTGAPVMAHDPMSLAHVVAAIVTVVMLHRGEWMLRAAGRGIHRLLPLRVVRPPHPLTVRRVRAAFRAPVPRALLLVADTGRRGPPLAV
jgi:hypothetical protein